MVCLYERAIDVIRTYLSKSKSVKEERETMPNCKECGWWKKIDEKIQGRIQGECIANPPTSTAVVMPVMPQITHQVAPQIIEVTSFPITVQEAEACGGFLDKSAVLEGIRRN